MSTAWQNHEHIIAINASSWNGIVAAVMIHWVNVVSVGIYGPYSPWVQRTEQFTPLVMEYTLLQSHLLGEILAFMPFAAAKDIPYSLAYFVPLGTHQCWVGRGSMEWKFFCPILLHTTSSGNQTPEHLILRLMPYPLSHMIPHRSKHIIFSSVYLISFIYLFAGWVYCPVCPVSPVCCGPSGSVSYIRGGVGVATSGPWTRGNPARRGISTAQACYQLRTEGGMLES